MFLSSNVADFIKNSLEKLKFRTEYRKIYIEGELYNGCFFKNFNFFYLFMKILAFEG